MDTRPHAPSVDVVLAGRGADFEAGVTCLAKLTSGPPYVCVGAKSSVTVPPLAGVKVERFDGPYPAGNAGTHIHSETRRSQTVRACLSRPNGWSSGTA